MAVHDLLGGVANRLLGEAVGHGLGAPGAPLVDNNVSGHGIEPGPPRAVFVQLTQQVRLVPARSPERQAALVGECAAHWSATLPSAPPLLPHYTHGGCNWFTGICSVPDHVTWLATGTERTASCSRGQRADADGRRDRR